MKLKIKAPACFGTHEIPPGEYLIGIRTDIRMFNLTGRGKDYQIPAVNRPSRRPTRVTDIQIIPAGGKSFSIVCRTPKQGEWIATLFFGTPSKSKS